MITGRDVIEKTARACWAKVNPGKDCPADKIPSKGELITWAASRQHPQLPPCPPDALAEATRRLAALYPHCKDEGGAWHWLEYFEDPPEPPAEFKPARSPDAEIIPRPHVEESLLAVFPLRVEDGHDGELAAWWTTPRTTFLATLPEMAAAYKALPLDQQQGFPLSPIVQAWQRIDPVVEPDKHHNAIAPDILRGGHLQLFIKSEAAKLPGDFGKIDGGQEQAVVELPSLETPKSGQLVPVLPLALYDHKGQLHNRNTRGPAPIALRLLFEGLLAVDYNLRQPNRVIPVEATLGEVKDWLWPTGWRRRDNLPQLQAALHELNDLLVRLEVDGDVGLYNLVMAHTRPDRDSSLDFLIRFQVFQLSGGGHGPLIDRQELRHWGATSAPAYRAYVRLAYLWDGVKARRGGRRVFATRPEVLRDAQGFLVDAQGRRITDRRGQPTKDWSNPQAVKTGEAGTQPGC